MNMELWYSEFQTKDLRLSARIKETLFVGKSDFQEVAVLDTFEFGRMLRWTAFSRPASLTSSSITR
jgi:spermidine synthase